MISSDISNKAPDHSKASTIDTPSTPSTPSIPSTPSTPSKPSIPSTPSTPVLIITYYWPPSGGAGVQRWLKFSKYLPETGWEPVILTVDTEYAVYPFIDSSLNEDVPANLKVYRTKALNWFRIYAKDKSRIPSAGFARNDDKTLKGRISRFIRGNFFIPDPRRGWNRYAFKKASVIIKDFDIKHIITTGPPHSTHLIGLRLKRKHPKIRWIADLRDPWTGIYYNRKFYRTAFARWLDNRYEKNVLTESDFLITVGQSCKEAYCRLVKGIENKFSIIENGYDPEDFSGLMPEKPEKPVLTYAGTISDAYPVEGLTAALKNLADENIRYNFRFVGTVPCRVRDSLVKELPGSPPEFISYLEHRKALELMMKSSVLVLIIPDHETNKSIITGKLFEYMATGRPVMCLGPADGDAAGILEKTCTGKTFGYNDIKGITDFLRRAVDTECNVNLKEVMEYTRIKLTRKITGVLNFPDKY